jgi:hypothetical protein
MIAKLLGLNVMTVIRTLTSLLVYVSLSSFVILSMHQKNVEFTT